jgi:hypothetical protein
LADRKSPAPARIAIERGPSLAILDPANNKTLVSLNNAGSDLRPMGRFYAFPKFGIYQSDRKANTVRQVVGGDFSTKVESSAVAIFPSSIMQLISFSRPAPHIVNGEPCLIWGETTDANSSSSISDIVVFDVKTNKEILRKALKRGFSSHYLVDSTARHIYFLNHEEKEFWSLNIQTGEMSPFAAGAGDELLAAN